MRRTRRRRLSSSDKADLWTIAAIVAGSPFLFGLAYVVGRLMLEIRLGIA